MSKKDVRGFSIYAEFKDSYNNTITVKESSSATKNVYGFSVKTLLDKKLHSI
jgi:hypothetical protein